ncbi:hypothetical protein MAXJ12_36151, partial [Mesorhizobium alhagi CCNWXJ12-2]
TGILLAYKTDGRVQILKLPREQVVLKAFFDCCIRLHRRYSQPRPPVVLVPLLLHL